VGSNPAAPTILSKFSEVRTAWRASGCSPAKVRTRQFVDHAKFAGNWPILFLLLVVSGQGKNDAQIETSRI
jgi:hypothetical protein